MWAKKITSQFNERQAENERDQGSHKNSIKTLMI